ncbi:MAG: hypothetical protein ABSA47_03455 [Verrucomicrobiota bacterium]|jgi:hypothetical protein
MKALPRQIVTTLGLLALGLAGTTVQAQISGFGGSGLGWTLNNSSGAAASVTSDVLNIVSGYGVGNSAFYDTPENISSFTASFVWQNTQGPNGDGFSPADGLVFTLQNQGVSAVGGGGSGLGYQGISSATGVAFNMWDGHTVGMGYAPTTVGNGTYGYSSTGSVNFDSTDPMSVNVSYSAGLLDVSVEDETTLAAYSTSYSVNLPSDAGGSTAFVGFTGGSGAGESDQFISDFTFTSVPDGGLTSALLAGALGLLGVARRRMG